MSLQPVTTNNKLNTVGTLEEDKPVTPLSTTPTATDYVNEAQKLGRQIFQSTVDISNRNLEETGQNLHRALIGKGQGASSQLAQQNIQKVMTQRNRELEPVQTKLASELGIKALDQQQETAATTLKMVQSGELAMTPAVAKQLQAAGYQTEGLKPTAQVEMQNAYGLDAEGNAFKSEAAAKQYWSSAENQQLLKQKYGLKDDGTPFKSESEAQLAEQAKKNAQEIEYKTAVTKAAVKSKYGIKEDGTEFQSEEEAVRYNDMKNLENRYGKRADGTSFASEEEAKADWAQRGFQTDLMNKYGLNETGVPYPDEKAAVDELVRKNNLNSYQAAITQQYGSPGNGKAFQTKEEALSFWESKGYDPATITKLGMDPVTKKPFASMDAGLAYWTGQGYPADVIKEFGVNPFTGKPPVSLDDAIRQTQLADVQIKYGTMPDGKQFQSEDQAVQWWVSKGYNKATIQKWGVPAGKVPFANDAAAKAYHIAHGADPKLLQLGTMNGVPFQSEREAQEYLALKDLEGFKSNLPPAIQDRIHSTDEWNFYMETGRTYDDQVAEVVSGTGGVDYWKTKLPELQSALQHYNDLWAEENRKEDGFITMGSRRDQHLLDEYDMKRNSLKQIISDINSGVVPVIEDASLNYLAPVKPADKPATSTVTAQPLKPVQSAQQYMKS